MLRGELPDPPHHSRLQAMQSSSVVLTKQQRVTKPEKCLCFWLIFHHFSCLSKSAKPNSNYPPVPRSRMQFFSAVHPTLWKHLVCLFSVSVAVHPFASRINRPLPPSFPFLFTFPPGVHPLTRHRLLLHPPLLSSYLNCKLQQCRLPEELLNVIRADPVD